MIIVFEMSTDKDIVGTPLSAGWQPENARYRWAQINQPQSLNIPGGAVIVVVAHGTNKTIGNEGPTLNITADQFLDIVQHHMQHGHAPAAIYISTCGEEIAGFAARVVLCAEANQMWGNTEIFGHHDDVSGPVPAPTPQSVEWDPIYQKRTRG
ncbi:DUF3168 domain-containing protein [Pseudomonas sp. IT-P12]|jgi:hypothetical protein|uniref:hypothetical protein n=1 Tax=Pseudomonas sp. IT-P12 TaxID=3026450 RepID=UPI0039E12192